MTGAFTGSVEELMVGTAKTMADLDHIKFMIDNTVVMTGCLFDGRLG